MAPRRLLGFVVSVFGIAACASIADLDPPDSDQESATGGEEPGKQEEVDNTPKATAGGVTVSTSTLDFAFGCGASDPKTFTVKNGGANPQPFELRIEGNTSNAFAIKDATNGVLAGTIAPNEERTFTVTATSQEAGAISADLKLKIDSEERTIAARATVNGALLTIGPASFGTVRDGIRSEATKFTLTNAGNMPVTVAGFDGPPGDFETPTNIVVQPNASMDADVFMKAGPAGDEVKATFTARGEGLCGQKPILAVSGRRVSDKILVSGDITFAPVSCNAGAPPAQKITISNFTIAEVPYNAVLPPNSKFTLGNATGKIRPSNGVVAEKVEISVIPNPPGNEPRDTSEKVTVTAGGETKDVGVAMRVQGARIELPNANVEIDDNKSEKFPIKNTGNMDIALCYVGYANTPSAWSMEQNDLLKAGETGDIEVSFDGDRDDRYSARVEVYRCLGVNTPVCNQLPLTLTMQGKGKRGGR